MFWGIEHKQRAHGKRDGRVELILPESGCSNLEC